MVPEIVRKVLLQGPNGKRNCTFTKLQQRQCPKKAATIYTYAEGSK